jgi:SET domain-containing protein
MTHVIEHRWLTKKAKAFKSPFHNTGIVALEDIKKGEDVLVYGGQIRHIADMQEHWDALGHVGTQIDDEFFIVPTSREELELKGTINHSCEPNTGFKDQVQLFAIRDIKSGEELTLDYAFCETSYPMNFSCNCGSKNCRKTVTNDDWKIKEIQGRYFDYFSPYIKRRIQGE